MSAGAYSDLKAAWHLDRIRLLREGSSITPAQVQLILSDLCNQDCHFCAYRMSGGFSSENFADEQGNKNPNRMIPHEKAREILRDCAELGVEAIQFTGGGEPAVHPHHMDLFEYAQSLGMKTSLVTNGVIFRLGWEQILPKMAWVRISLDAGTAETYAAVRRTSPASFDKALLNAALLAGEIAKQGTACVLGIGFVITRENYHEITRAAKLARAAGVHNVRLSAMFSRDFAAYYEGLVEEIDREIRLAKELACKEFQVFDLFGDRISDLKQHAPDYSLCGYQHFNVYVGGDQKVYRCCNTSYTNHGQVGDLRDQSFAEWFASTDRHDAYKNFDARSCEICQFNNKNRVINYLVDPEPVHVEFV